MVSIKNKNSSFSKSISLTLILSQLFFSVAGRCDQALPATDSYETQLLTNVIALQGQKLSRAELQKQMTAELSKYNVVAPKEGRIERLKSSLISLQVETPAQAEELANRLSLAQERLKATPNLSESEAEQALAAELNQAIGAVSGAQFSACSGTTWAVVGVVFVAGVVGLVASQYIQQNTSLDGTNGDIAPEPLNYISVGLIGASLVAAWILASDCGE